MIRDRLPSSKMVVSRGSRLNLEDQVWRNLLKNAELHISFDGDPGKDITAARRGVFVMKAARCTKIKLPATSCWLLALKLLAGSSFGQWA